MLRLHTLILLSALVTGPLCHAQTGPIGGSGPANPPLAPVNTGVNQGLTPDRMSTYFRNLGNRVDSSQNNGTIYLKVQMQREGWNYLFTVEFSPDQQRFNLSMPFGNTSAMPATQLQEILKASFRIHPFHFNIREANGSSYLWLDGPFYNTTIPEDAFQRILEQFLKAVRDSQTAWDSSRYAAAPAGGTMPVGNAPVGAVASQGLVNTTWVGSENLANYGRLEFRFQANGQAVMIDAAGSHPGTYVVQGNSVTLTFGGVIYNGTLNGNTIAGYAYNVGNAQQKWSFSVSR